MVIEEQNKMNRGKHAVFMLSNGTPEGSSDKVHGLLLVSLWPFRRHIGYFYTAKSRLATGVSYAGAWKSSMNSSTNEFKSLFIMS